MGFSSWLKEQTDPKQLLFPFMSEEEPLDFKKIGRYKSLENYIKARTKGARKTEQSAQRIVSAEPNSFWAGREEIERVYNSEIIIPPKQFSNGQIRPEYHIAFAHLKNLELPGKYRLLAFWQGRPPNRLTKAELLSNYHPIIGGLVHIGGHLTHAWVDPNYKSPEVSIYKALREFAKRYYGVVGPAPDEDLLSKSYLTAQAKYEWDKWKKLKDENVPSMAQ